MINMRTVSHVIFLMFFVLTSILNVCLLLTHCYWRSAHVLYVIRLNCGMRGCFNAPYIMFIRIFSFPMGGMSAKHFPKIVSKLPCHSTVICFPVGVCYVVGFMFLALLPLTSDALSISHWRNVCEAFTKDSF